MSHPIFRRIKSVFSKRSEREGDVEADITADGDRTEHSDPAVADGEGVPTFPDQSHTRPELASKVGVTPEEYVADLVAEHRTLSQQQIIEFTGLSASTTSRLLKQMEDTEAIKRVQIGQEKFVLSPNASLADIDLGDRGWFFLPLGAVQLAYARYRMWFHSTAEYGIRWVVLLMVSSWRFLVRVQDYLLSFLPKVP